MYKEHRRLQERNDTRIPQREKTHLSGMSVGPQASFDVVMLPCPLFCLLQFLESGVDMFDRLYSVPAHYVPACSSSPFAVCRLCSARSTSAGLSFCGLENRVADGDIIITENSNRVAIFINFSPYCFTLENA